MKGGMKPLVRWEHICDRGRDSARQKIDISPLTPLNCLHLIFPWILIMSLGIYTAGTVYTSIRHPQLKPSQGALAEYQCSLA